MKATAPVAMVIAALLFSGCSASQLINTGGDTKCKDFTTQDEKKQNDEVSKMLKDKSGQDPTNLEITATKASVTLYCQALGKEYIGNADRAVARLIGLGEAREDRIPKLPEQMQAASWQHWNQ